MLPTLPPHIPAPDKPVRVGSEHMSFRGSRWLIGVVVGIGLLWAFPNASAPGPLPAGPQVPLQTWGSGVDVLPVLARTIPGGLPAPDARQRKPPCQTHMGEEAINGVCWLRLDIEPPCPAGQAWERNGKCYAYALKVVQTPQSGEVRAGNVAGEP